MAGSLLGTCGFEGQSGVRDRLTILLGAATYIASTVPTGASAWSLRGYCEATRPWLAVGALVEPVGNVYYVHAQLFKNTNDTSNDLHRVGTARGNTEQISISLEDSTLKPTIRLNGVVVATAASYIYSISTWERLILKVNHVDTGLIEVFANGDLTTAIVSYTLGAGDITSLGGKPNGFYMLIPAAADRLDDLIAYDPAGTGSFDSDQDLGQSSVAPRVFTGNGADTAWTGTFADIDELPANDADDISATAVGQRSNFSKAAIGEPRVLGVQMMARVTRTGTAAGSQIEFYQTESALNTDAGIQAAPGDGDAQEVFQLQRDGTAWTATDFDNTTFGVVSRT